MSSSEVTETEARLALSSIDRRRQQVIAEINVPLWYWLSVSAGWVALGALSEFGPAWGAIAGTVAFGAAHAAVAPRVLSGRHGSRRLSVRRDLVSRRRVSTLVFGFLIVMTAVTVALALLAHADGARHAAILASVVVAALVLSGGPSLMVPVRRRAEQHLQAA
jgi:hypothetical protein